MLSFTVRGKCLPIQVRGKGLALQVRGNGLAVKGYKEAGHRRSTRGLCRGRHRASLIRAQGQGKQEGMRDYRGRVAAKATLSF